MKLSITMLLPIAGGIYGAFIGWYFHGKKKSPKARIALWIAGIMLLLLCIATLTAVFTR